MEDKQTTKNIFFFNVINLTYKIRYIYIRSNHSNLSFYFKVAKFKKKKKKEKIVMNEWKWKWYIFLRIAPLI